jgi:hypothetical protein
VHHPRAAFLTEKSREFIDFRSYRTFLLGLLVPIDGKILSGKILKLGGIYLLGFKRKRLDNIKNIFKVNQGTAHFPVKSGPGPSIGEA